MIGSGLLDLTNQLPFLFSSSKLAGKLSKKKPRASKWRFEVDCTLFTLSTLFEQTPFFRERCYYYCFRQVFWLVVILLSAPSQLNTSGFMQISSHSQRRDRGWISQPSLFIPSNTGNLKYINFKRHYCRIFFDFQGLNSISTISSTYTHLTPESRFSSGRDPINSMCYV